MLKKSSLALAGAFAFIFAVFNLTNTVNAQTYTTIANGDWTSATTWQGSSIPPTASDIPSTAVINVRHTVLYDRTNPIKNRGEIRIEPIVGTIAKLTVPTAVNIENHPTGRFLIINATFVQCRFVLCNDGETYSGNSPGAAKQSGTLKNLGGYNEARNSNVEIAQDWTNETSGRRVIVDSCVKTGQNFSLSSLGSVDTITRSQISIGWHSSGNFDHADGTGNYTRVKVQLAGTSGSFKLNSGTVNGSIDCVQLRNGIVPFNGSGEIFASSSVSSSGIDLGAYCVSPASQYIPNGKFTGAQTPECGGICLSCLAPTAAPATIAGRVMTSDGRGIRNAIIELVGGTLGEPVRTRSSAFGYYSFDDLPAGETYALSVYSKQYSFSGRVVFLGDSVSDLDFIAEGTTKVSDHVTLKQR